MYHYCSSTVCLGTRLVKDGPIMLEIMLLAAYDADRMLLRAYNS